MSPVTAAPRDVTPFTVTVAFAGIASAGIVAVLMSLLAEYAMLYEVIALPLSAGVFQRTVTPLSSGVATGASMMLAGTSKTTKAEEAFELGLNKVPLRLAVTVHV